MKKIFLLLAIASVAFTSCEDAKPEVFDKADGEIAYFTKGTASSFFVRNVPDAFTEVEVGVTVASPTDRTIAVTIDPTSTATANQYTIENASLVIPANKFVGKIKIKGNYANTLTAGSRLILNLTSVSGAKVATFDNKFTLTIFQFCPLVRSQFLGTYNCTEFNAAGAQIDAYVSVITAGVGPKDIVMTNIYNAFPSSQTKMTLNDTNPANFRVEFPPFLENLLGNFGPANGNAFVEGFPGSFSACTRSLDFTYRLRFGPANTGASMTVTYRVVAVPQ